MLKFENQVTWTFIYDVRFSDRYEEGVWWTKWIIKMASCIGLKHMRDYDYTIEYGVEHYHPCCKHCGEPFVDVKLEKTILKVTLRFEEKVWTKFIGSECYTMIKSKDIRNPKVIMEFEDGVKMEVVLE